MTAELFYVCWMILSTGYQGRGNEPMTLDAAQMWVNVSNEEFDGIKNEKIVHWACEAKDLKEIKGGRK